MENESNPKGRGFRRPFVWLVLLAGVLIGSLVISPAASYARHLIQTDDIENGAVTTAKLADNSVTAAKIKNGAVKLVSTERAGVRTLLAPGEFGAAEATCNSGETLTGGGYVARGIHVLVTSFVIRDGVTFWVVQGTNISDHDEEIGALADCTKVLS